MTNIASKRMASLGIEEIKGYVPEISKFKDFSRVADEIREKGFEKTLFLLLGNSLGNFEINEMLFELRKAMKEGDVLLIGNALSTEWRRKILQPYGSKEIQNFFVEIPKHCHNNQK